MQGNVHACAANHLIKCPLLGLCNSVPYVKLSCAADRLLAYRHNQFPGFTVASKQAAYFPLNKAGGSPHIILQHHTRASATRADLILL